MIANAGSDENKKYHGGKAGDQTGKEYRVMSWYSRPWSCVLRYPDIRVGVEIASISRAAALNDYIGYDQWQRATYYEKLKAANWDPSKIKDPCECDCSASTAANIQAAGHRLGNADLQKVNPGLTTSVMRKALMAAGFDCLTDPKYLTSDQYLLPGDILLYDGHHVAVNLDRGTKAGDIRDDDHVTQVAWYIIRKGLRGAARRAYCIEQGENPSIVQARINEMKKLGLF